MSKVSGLVKRRKAVDCFIEIEVAEDQQQVEQRREGLRWTYDNERNRVLQAGYWPAGL